MKHKILLFTVITVIITIVSCKKSIDQFLDKAPGVDVNEDVVFSTRLGVESEVSTMYYFGMVSIFPCRDAAILASPTGTSTNLQGTLAGATDESEASANFSYVQNINSGGITPSSVISGEDTRYYGRFKAIRYANILLERIDAVPDPLVTDDYKKQVKGEARFIRALSHFETLKRYGGIPIIKKRFATGVEANIPRSSFADCIDFIAKDLDTAANLLPYTYTTSQKGRATKMAALALKSRLLLYAASPLFNTATPYISMADPANNKLICYGNYDQNRWNMAAAAAKDAIDAAAPSNVALIDINARLNRNPTDAQLLQGNYRVAWELQDNTEVIIADKSYGKLSQFNFPWYHLVPSVFNSFFTANTALLNLVSKYEDTLGKPVTWDPAGANDLVAKYNSLDKRFKQTMGYNGGRWNATYPIIETFQGGAHASLCFGGSWVVKHVPDALGNGGSAVPSIAYLRLNEIYLNYAEALSESVGGNITEATDYVNRIRVRSGQPAIPILALPLLKDKIRNERVIELAYEDHRFWDIRRWMIAEQDGVMKGNMMGLTITKLTPTTFRYVPYVIETRTFNRQFYLHPFDQNEILKSNGVLIQNPGW